MINKTKNGKARQKSKKKNNTLKTLAKPEVADLIGQRLRTFYDDVAKQPVPDRFLDLLNQLQAANPSEKKT